MVRGHLASHGRFRPLRGTEPLRATLASPQAGERSLGSPGGLPSTPAALLAGVYKHPITSDYKPLVQLGEPLSTCRGGIQLCQGPGWNSKQLLAEAAPAGLLSGLWDPRPLGPQGTLGSRLSWGGGCSVPLGAGIGGRVGQAQARSPDGPEPLAAAPSARNADPSTPLRFGAGDPLLGGRPVSSLAGSLASTP